MAKNIYYELLYQKKRKVIFFKFFFFFFTYGRILLKHLKQCLKKKTKERNGVNLAETGECLATDSSFL